MVSTDWVFRATFFVYWLWGAGTTSPLCILQTENVGPTVLGALFVLSVLVNIIYFHVLGLVLVAGDMFSWDKLKGCNFTQQHHWGWLTLPTSSGHLQQYRWVCIPGMHRPDPVSACSSLFDVGYQLQISLSRCWGCYYFWMYLFVFVVFYLYALFYIIVWP